MRPSCSDALGLGKVFQIPMRGNELNLQHDRASAIMFQIPMRGNERNGRDASGPVGTRFQIPMRGNEAAPGWIVLEGKEVSNPHEG